MSRSLPVQHPDVFPDLAQLAYPILSRPGPEATASERWEALDAARPYFEECVAILEALDREGQLMASDRAQILCARDGRGGEILRCH